MATELIFIEGGNEMETPGVALPAISVFRLSPKPIAFDLSVPVAGDLYTGSTFADCGEVAWTGYSRKNVATPAAVNKIVTYNNINWNTGASIDGNTNVRSIILENDVRNKIIFAWDIRQLISTITTGSHTLPVGTLNVVTTANFYTAGVVIVGGQAVTYTGKTPTALTGCTGGTGVISAGTTVLQDGLDMSKANSTIFLAQLQLFAQNPGGT